MALVLEQIHTPGIEQLSYLIGDDDTKVAAVVDPRRDVDVYLELAREHGVWITHAIETHIHADFVSGSRELAARTGARVLGGRSGDYGFEIEAIDAGDRIALGDASLRAIHTPGHTPEHVSLLLSHPEQGEEPFAVLTGDTLLNLAVGRPDLIGEGVEERLARQLHRSLFETLLPLGDRMELLPGHTAGSACAASIGQRRRSTLGNERLFNAYLRAVDEEDFVRSLLEGLPEPPRHYARLKRVNAEGAPIRGRLPDLRPLTAQEFQQRMERADALVLDTRAILAFGGGHIPGALHIPLGTRFPTWVGWMVDPAATLLLVAESAGDARLATEHLFRLGYDDIGGFLHPSMTPWQNAALPLESTGEWTVHQLDRRRSDPDVQVLDVRGESEWREGHVPGARHIFLPHLEENLDRLDRGKTVVAYCGSGYRSSIAASVLQRNGFRKVATVPGSMTAWKAAGLPM